MVAIAAMAVQIRDVAHGIHSAGFAVSYVVLRSIMLVLYWRAWRAVPEARPLIRLYGGGYSVAVAIWLLSLAFSPPARYVVWGIAIALELSCPRSVHISIGACRRAPATFPSGGRCSR
jgi:low temperature requirement protein LtrA